MGRLAPDDDRVWLGRAHLAIQTNAPDEAKVWLDRCQERRPNDPAVWKAWLQWGMATNRPKLVEQAIERIPAEMRALADIHRAAAWLKAARNDKPGERQELERLTAIAPTDLKAFERLATLDGTAAKPSFTAELKGKRAEIDEIWSRYTKLYARNQHIRDAEEMARLAEALGRVFEARVAISLALSEEPDREDLKQEFSRLGQKLAIQSPPAPTDTPARPRTLNKPE
jgi:tetratricopeptide (TPR) repeat protein